jgi:hypothetical protein
MALLNRIYFYSIKAQRGLLNFFNSIFPPEMLINFEKFAKFVVVTYAPGQNIFKNN